MERDSLMITVVTIHFMLEVCNIILCFYVSFNFISKGRTIVQPMDYEQMVPMKSYNKIFQLEHDSLATSPLPVESSFSKSLEAVTSHNPVYESCEILTSYNQVDQLHNVRVLCFICIILDPQYSSLQHQVGLCVPNNASSFYSKQLVYH